MPRKTLSAALVVAVAGACDNAVEVCNLVDYAVTVDVVDGDGEPVSGLATTVRHVESGEMIEEAGLEMREGEYVLIQSSHLDTASGGSVPLRDGHQLEATWSDGATEVTEVYEVYFRDASCGEFTSTSPVGKDPARFPGGT